MARTESAYPGALDTFINQATDFNPGDAIPSTDFEKMMDAIRKIETELGTDPAGSLTDVKTRLAVSLNNDGTLKGPFSFDDAVTINNSEADKDFRIAAVGATNAFFVQGSDGKTGFGTAVIPHGGEGYALLALEGTDGSAAGPHIQATTAADDYPLMQILNWAHDEVAIYFDAYRDAGGELSSDAGSNFRIGKGLTADTFSIEYDSGIAQGAAITWNTGISLDTSGNVTVAGTLKANGNGVIEGDTTGGRVRRASYITIANGSNANTLKCTLTNRWNGDTIAETDNVAKGATTGNFTLDAGGTHLTIEAAGLSGNVVNAIANVIHNASNTIISNWTEVVSNDIEIQLKLITTGAAQDITVLVDTGSVLLDVLYITDA